MTDVASWVLHTPVRAARPVHVVLPTPTLAVDQVLHVTLASGHEGLSHLEFQGRRSHDAMQWRMQEYISRLAHTYRLDLESVVIYIGRGARIGNSKGISVPAPWPCPPEHPSAPRRSAPEQGIERRRAAWTGGAGLGKGDLGRLGGESAGVLDRGVRRLPPEGVCLDDWSRCAARACRDHARGRRRQLRSARSPGRAAMSEQISPWRLRALWVAVRDEAAS